MQLLAHRNRRHPIFGCMRGTVKILGDIESPAWDGPWDAELGIAYRGENGTPVYYTGNGIETTDDLHQK
ncbi:MAG: hypothetical protein JWM43_3329 [Acidobacteriaceae bacterium]|nr:hypothetical protein [Acidobacteriaceae bacterium]